MPVAGFTVGRDISIKFNLPQGPRKFSNITGFTRKQISTAIDSKGLDGEDRFGEIPSGWEGTVEIDRADNQLDIAISYLEELYFAGQNVPSSTFSETITEVNGTVTQYRYTKVVLKFDNAGDAKGDAKVVQTFSWKASRRRLISPRPN
jgi:hypothetical protein